MPDRAALIEPHIPALRRYAWALCRDGHEADDLVQDCLERALGAWHLRRFEGGVRAWLFTILHNSFLSDRRRAMRRGPHGPLTEADEPGQDATQEERLVVQNVVTALADLPDDQRAVLLIGTVMSRLSRGRERLRRAVDGERPALRRVK